MLLLRNEMLARLLFVHFHSLSYCIMMMLRHAKLVLRLVRLFISRVSQGKLLSLRDLLKFRLLNMEIVNKRYASLEARSVLLLPPPTGWKETTKL